jgi:hypothetical protein
MMFYVLIILILILLCIIVCHKMARNRGLKAVFWGLMGGIFGPLPIPFILFLGTKSSSHAAN